MKKIFTKGLFTVSAIILFLTLTLPSLAQYTKSTLESGGQYTAIAKDASGNVYVTRLAAGGGSYQVVKYTNGTGIPVTLISGLTFEIEDYPWGLAVASNGDVYISTDFSSLGGAIIKLTASTSIRPQQYKLGDILRHLL